MKYSAVKIYIAESGFNKDTKTKDEVLLCMGTWNRGCLRSN